MKVAEKDPMFGLNEKRGLVTIGCLLATHSDAAVREQAQELLAIAITDESLGFVTTFFERHRYAVGNRVVQEARIAFQDQNTKVDA